MDDIARYDGTSLAGDPADAVRRAMRHAMTYDDGLRATLAAAGSQQSVARALFNAFEGSYAEEDVRSVADELALEHASMKASPGLYLVSGNTGKTVLKLSPDMIYQPPPQLRPDGALVKPDPIIHPKVSSAVAMVVQDKAKLSELERVYPGSPALSHLRDPNGIVNEAERVLAGDGIATENPMTSDESFRTETFEFGHENSTGVFQGFNHRFHRTASFGASLARLIRQTGTKTYWVLSIKRCGSAKRSWYEATVLIRAPEVAS